jgi:hypothetical protein
MVAALERRGCCSAPSDAEDGAIFKRFRRRLYLLFFNDFSKLNDSNLFRYIQALLPWKYHWSTSYSLSNFITCANAEQGWGAALGDRQHASATSLQPNIGLQRQLPYYYFISYPLLFPKNFRSLGGEKMLCISS